MAACQAVLFGLAMVKSIKVYRHDRREGIATTQMFIVLAQDSILYFGGVTIVITTNMLVWAVARVGAL